jgi:hypothetical protein
MSKARDVADSYTDVEVDARYGAEGRTRSSTDTTTGRLLKVGDFGIGAAGTAKTRPTDADSITAAGFYVLSGAALNIPSSNAITIMHQDWDGITTIAAQTATELTSYTQWFRVKQAGVWTAWKEIYHTGNEQQIGVGQTWQDVRGSRKLGVTYTNTTGKPIEILVSIGRTTTNPTHLDININSMGWVRVGEGGRNAYEGYASATVIIPSGSRYALRAATGSASLRVWMELR